MEQEEKKTIIASNEEQSYKGTESNPIDAGNTFGSQIWEQLKKLGNTAN